MSDASWFLSLNEVETLSLKAARGAGAGWGVAEDVARATRWMAMRRLDWSGSFLVLLRTGAIADQMGLILRVADELVGAKPGDTWHLEAAAPLWAIAILSNALHGRDLTLDVHWPTGRLRLRPDDGVSADDPPTAIENAGWQALAVTAGALVPALPHAIRSDTRRSLVSHDTWAALETSAARTYVPATAQSRARGAGGERIDAD